MITRIFLLVFSLFLLPSLALQAFAADHKDAPLISEDKALDLLDVFAFVSPTDSSKVVLAGTVNGFTVPGELSVGFAQNALYEFKIDNDGDFKEDKVIQATFTKIGSSQQVTLRGPANPKKIGSESLLLGSNQIVLTGAANGSTLTSTDGTISVFAGVRDDPFYTDLIWVLRQIGVQAGGPLSRAKGIDFLAGLNCSILAVELPSSLLVNGDDTDINVWGTTSRPLVVKSSSKKDPRRGLVFVQVDRTAAPVVNTVINSLLTDQVAAKDQFNRTSPSRDRALFRQTAIDAIVAIGVLNAADAGALVDAVLIPDVLHLDVSNSSGFTNGRRPSDDVINTILNAASNGAITSDGVDANDATFSSTFPYFAPPHSLLEGVPARDATS